MLPAMFWFIWPSGFRGGDFKKIGQSETRIACGRPCLVMDHSKMCTLQRGHSIDASYQVSVHLAKQFQRRRFFTNRPIRNKNCMWCQCLLTDRDEMSNLSEDIPQMLPTKFRFIWPSGFRGEVFLNRPIRNKNCLWRPCLLMDRDKMYNLQIFLSSFSSFG